MGFRRQAIGARGRQPLYPKGEKAYTTVQTVMNNLAQKGYLKREKIGLVNFTSQQKSAKRWSEKPLKRLSSVSSAVRFKPLPITVRSDALTKEKINELKKILEQKAKEKNND